MHALMLVFKSLSPKDLHRWTSTWETGFWWNDKSMKYYSLLMRCSSISTSYLPPQTTRQLLSLSQLFYLQTLSAKPPLTTAEGERVNEGRYLQSACQKNWNAPISFRCVHTQQLDTPTLYLIVVVRKRKLAISQFFV